ncbi:amino acid adenylation domain-containing protein [Flavobacterium nitrogenifigens]|uniref:Amino acid adenylation domain-containing protein n=2 Tax=Flavobacterium TaxID=237 RepID=A0A7W7IY06_9FLAO|nr:MULTISPECIES: polyketide synthase [Flavobacterium]MBB4802525.1 amino acid adenylation domain-containing protein [Flavobacterium nitrogenifigens]MBB6387483.1 amino acid adenylation domain-containing protein [Flavobacterium notoginsengisoli]
MKRSNNNNSDKVMIGAEMVYPKNALHELFAKQAETSPNAIALEFDDQKITYAALANKANLIANYFLDQGLSPGQFVAVSMDRSPNLIASLFAILQCGAAYLPLDPKFPTERLEFMLEDSEAAFLLTTEALSTSLPKSSKTILIEEVLSSLDQYPSTPLSLTVSPENVAYIMYTSGSTGKPKGVTVTHQNLVNFLYSMAIEPGIEPADKLLSITTISFDIAGLELFLPLIKGASVVFADYETTRDGQLLFNLLKEKEITILQATPTTWQLLLDSGWNTPLPIKALCGGEAMPLNLARALTSRCNSLWNMYGPTETTVWSAVKQIKAEDELITVGFPIANTQIYLLDENRKVVESGEIGEIVIGGDGVAQGYWKRSELTAEKFIQNPFSDETNTTIYRTGDLGKILPNGELQCLGRIDHQVKLRGHRIELGEIEATLNTLSGIKQSAVIVSRHFGNEDKLVAYLKTSGESGDEKLIQEALSKILPEILIPSKYIWIEEFPITPNGKIDKKNLPLPENSRPDSAPLYKKPTTKLEKEIAKIWSEELKIAEIGINDDFFDIGGSSVLAQKVTTAIKQLLAVDVPVSKIYIHPTIKELASTLEDQNNTEDSFEFKKPNEYTSSADIAVIGMAGRFPGSDTIEELWENLRDGKETISLFTKEELDSSLPESLRNDPLYIGARGVLPSAKTFDPSFFGLNPQLAAAMDPQIRVFLEISFEALEQAGHLPKHYKGSIGVYSGSEINTYYENNIFNNKELKSSVGELQIYTVNGKDFIAPRTSYHLNLKGPSVSVHSACSTSLLAVAEAVKAIRTGMCDVALAGGSSVTCPINSGHLYDEGFIKSPDGSTRSFDASGKGTVFSDGAGVVLLKRLEEAEKDGDIIYGVIKGVGVNNDGGDKGSFMAPSPKGQAGAIINAFNDAQVSPSSISYMEAHGTATPIGDPIEIEGLKIAYGKQEKNNYCALGSIKSNMGHTTAAAGVAGLIKVLLAMRHKQIPPMVNFEKPNPNIDFENSPFYVNNKLIEWKSDSVRRAGVSSFGIGSTNVHVIVEEYDKKPEPSSAGRPMDILMWSAKSQNSLLGYENTLGQFIDKAKETPLADIAYSLNITRDDFNHRSFLLADSTVDAAEKLISLKTKNTKSSVLKSVPSELGFLFPGQGSQYLQMGKKLYDNEKVYREAVDKCAGLLMEELGLDIREVLYPKDHFTDAEELLRNTRLTQPSLFVTEYALAQLWLSWGIKPTFLCGHSIGEFAAAHLAGILNLKDALHIVAVRGRLISQLPGGSMLIVRVPVETLNELKPDTLSIAAINSKQFCVVSGKKEDIALFNAELDAKEIPNRLLNTSHAFHSFMMEPILGDFRNELEKIKLNIPRLPIISTATGTWLTDTEATDPTYWVNQLKNTVHFADAMDTAFELEDFVLLEVGPGQTLITLARQQAAGKIIPAFPSINFPKDDNDNEYTTLLTALGELWLRGINPDWKAFYGQQQRQKIDLPNYIFDRKPCWIEPLGVPETIVPQKTAVSETLAISIEVENKTTETKHSRKEEILSKIADIIKNASGIEYEVEASSNTFLELGLDSLSLTQLSGKLKKEFDLPITFRQLNEAYSTPSLLADYIETNLPEEVETVVKEVETIIEQASTTAVSQNGTQLSSTQSQISLEQIVQQIQLLSQKVDQLQNFQSTSVNGNSSFVNLKAENFDVSKFNNELKHETNGFAKTNGNSAKEKMFDISAIHDEHRFVNDNHEKKYTIKSNEPPVQGSKLGRDESGNPAWFIEDPSENGSFVKIKL